ncbi:SGNH/GDSL hydrolase family protein [Pseudomonas sp.]|uniref:SGNH/GDSL hydrolase family protein n=1 Tax=Pseudomonas sp. TaxID=306 RepID=UPI0031D01969
MLVRKLVIAACFTLAISSAHATDVLIEAYGDSTTEGWQVINGVSVISPNSETKVLERMLQQKYGTGVRISNQGVGGTQASQLFYGLDGKHPIWEDQMRDSVAKIITLNMSLNDAYFQSVPTAGILAESPQAYAEILKQLIFTARKYGKEVVLYEPHPVCKEPRQSKLQYYVAHMNIVAAETSTPIVAHYYSLLNIPDWKSMLSDCVHPFDAMYKLKAELEFPVITSIIDRISP